jgi:hypothetical protein
LTRCGGVSLARFNLLSPLDSIPLIGGLALSHSEEGAQEGGFADGLCKPTPNRVGIGNILENGSWLNL